MQTFKKLYTVYYFHTHQTGKNILNLKVLSVCKNLKK